MSERNEAYQEPHISTIKEAVAYAAKIGYPLLLRPWASDGSVQEYVVEGEKDLRHFFGDALKDSKYESRVYMTKLTGSHTPGPRYPAET